LAPKAGDLRKSHGQEPYAEFASLRAAQARELDVVNPFDGAEAVQHRRPAHNEYGNTRNCAAEVVANGALEEKSTHIVPPAELLIIFGTG
jgi:hypothetical protein